MLEYIEVIKDHIKDDQELDNLQITAMNSLKAFERSQQKASIGAAKNLKNIDLLTPHPIFAIEDHENQEALDELLKYRPNQSYLELSSRKETDKNEENANLLNLINSMKKLKKKVNRNQVRKAVEIKAKKELQLRERVVLQHRELVQEEMEAKAKKAANKYKSSLFIHHTEDLEVQKQFFKKEKMTGDELSTFTMTPEVVQLYEHRKFVWDPKKRNYKKLKIDVRGNVVRENWERVTKGESVTERYKKWKKRNLIGIQREGEDEIKEVSAKAKTMLTKRTKG